MQLTSPHNPLLLGIRRAAHSGRPTDDGWIVAEGPHLLTEILRSRWAIQTVLVTEEAQQRHPELLPRIKASVIQVSKRAFRSTAATESPQGILSLVRPPAWTWEDLTGLHPLLVILDGIQDPGNAGTLVRSAEAFSASGIIFTSGSVRIANGKLLRAAAGSLFRMPFWENVARHHLLEQLTPHSIRLYSLTAASGIELARADLKAASALIVGSEGAGIAPELLIAAESVSIPTAGVESLNAAVAGSIALFEAARQRRSAHS